MPEPTVEILLLTYNRRRYLDDLMASLAGQTETDWRILAMDNASTDGTPEVLLEWQRRLGPDKLRIINRAMGGNAGPVRGFESLLIASTGKYVMFCDCDDIWLATKVGRTLARMRAADDGKPVLVHSDLKVADEVGKVVAESFHAYQHLNPVRGARFQRLLMQNCVTGCTVMLNRPMIARSLPIPPEAIMHDWWIALVAAAFGRIEFLPESTILYRQHDANALGAVRFDVAYVVQRAAKLLKPNEMRAMESRIASQARAFVARFGPALPKRCLLAARACGTLGTGNWATRRIRRIRHRLSISTE